MSCRYKADEDEQHAQVCITHHIGLDCAGWVLESTLEYSPLLLIPILGDSLFSTFWYSFISH